MPDIIAGFVVVGLVVERIWAEHLHARERRYLINAKMAANPAELRQLEAKPRSERKRKELPDGYEGQVGI